MITALRGGILLGMFAIVAAWLTWRTGGLEAAISLHIVNNVLIFLLGSVALVDANASSGTAVDLVASALAMVVYALLADRWAARLGIARTAQVTGPITWGPSCTAAPRERDPAVQAAIASESMIV